jgi:signal transduction histidine kinase
MGLASAIVAATIALVVFNRAHIHTLDDLQPIEIVLGISYSIVGAVIASRRPRNAIGWMFLGVGVLAATPGVTGQYYIASVTRGHLPGAEWAAWLQNWIVIPIFPAGLALFIFLLYPNGRLQSPRWRVLAWMAVVLDVLVAVFITLDPTPIEVGSGLPPSRNPTGIPGFPIHASSIVGGVLFLAGVGLLGAAVVGTGLRLRRVRGEERQQLKWFAYAAIATVAALIAEIPLSFIVHNLPDGAFDWVIILGFGLAIPIACGIAILRHGLYEIDVVINKTVVVGVLAVFITLIYVGLVVGLGAVVGSKGNALLSIVATAIIAVAFQPVRMRARRLADRLVYGKRATPYEVLSDFSERMAGAVATDDVLPRMVRVLAEGTGASRADVWLVVGSSLRRSALWPATTEGVAGEVALTDGELPPFEGTSIAVPVRHQGELLGALTVSKPPAEPLTPAEQKLVQDLASQAGLVLRNVRLAAELLARLNDLQASRQRLVAAQDHERRRLERNIHDGAQQQLVAMAVKLRLANNLTDRDPAKARAMLTELETDITETLEDLRDLARGIYPPLLADKGLVAALQAQGRKSPIPVKVEADEVGRYAQEVEAAVYFCCLEALQNAAKYSGATEVRIRLSGAGEEIAFEVRDGGRGFEPATTPRGAGLTNMTDRLSALGGELEIASAPGMGTTLTGRIRREPDPGRS